MLFRVIPRCPLPPPCEDSFEDEEHADKEEGGGNQFQVCGLRLLPDERGETRKEDGQAQEKEPAASPSARHGAGFPILYKACAGLVDAPVLRGIPAAKTR